nr:unnamed protein product [Spirometra erinaceieuropaei]
MWKLPLETVDMEKKKKKEEEEEEEEGGEEEEIETGTSLGTVKKKQPKNIIRPILAHIVDSGHRADPNEAFCAIDKVTPNDPRPLGQRLLAKVKPTAIISLRKPSLREEEDLVQTSRLSWPESG